MIIEKYTTPDGTVSITWSGDIQEKIELLALFGITYTPTAEELQTEIDIEQLREAYVNMIARLEQIQAATNPTNAQVIQAIKDEALYIERIMKFLKKLLT